MRWLAILLVLLVSACSESTDPSDEEADEEAWYFPIPVPEILDREPKPSRIIYLNREGATLFAGPEEASENRSSIVTSAGLETYTIPAFRGAPRRWDDIVTCIRGHFERYDVEVVEQRPIVPGYMMAVMGGRPGDLADSVDHTHGNILGLAPFNGQPIENAIVLIFTRQLRERTRQTCETAAMEIAHAYGLDHTYECRDLMTYRRRCGRRRFVDDDMACGEHEERPCVGPSETQSSHARLIEVLGARASDDER